MISALFRFFLHSKQGPFGKLYIITAISFCINFSALGQKLDTANTLLEDGWIENFNHKIGIDFSFNNSYETFQIKTPTTQFTLYPNTATKLRLNVNYRFFSLGIQYAPDFIPGNGDENLKGKTKTFELKTSFIFKHWFTHISYSKVKGYYLKNTVDFIPIMEGDPFIQFPDLHYFGIINSIGYSSNSKFSFRSLTSQTERQLKSAGSFIPTLQLGYYGIDDRSSGNSTQKSANFESSIGPGYVYTFVHKQAFYLSLGLQASLGYLNTKLTTRQPEENIITFQDNLVYGWDTRAGIGYNGRKFYSGIYSTISGLEYKQQSTTAKNYETRILYHFFLGIRISAPEIAKRKVNQIETLFKK